VILSALTALRDNAGRRLPAPLDAVLGPTGADRLVNI
jgi:hypothetical protein